MGEVRWVPMHYHVGPDAEECASCGRDFSDLIHLRPVQALESPADELARLHEELYRTTRERDGARECLDRMIVAEEQVHAENRELRKMLWLNHGCDFASLYGDDGHMQCPCLIDFASDSVSTILAAWKRGRGRVIAALTNTGGDRA